MRKFLAICLLLIYSVCSTGATIYLHHCGKNTIVSVLDKEKGSYDSCPMCADQHRSDATPGTEFDRHHNGCHDVYLQLDLKSEIEQPQPNWLFGNTFDFSPFIVYLPWIITFKETGFDTYYASSSAAPPAAVADAQDTHLFNCTFRI